MEILETETTHKVLEIESDDELNGQPTSRAMCGEDPEIFCRMWMGVNCKKCRKFIGGNLSEQQRDMESRRTKDKRFEKMKVRERQMVRDTREHKRLELLKPLKELGT